MPAYIVKGNKGSCWQFLAPLSVITFFIFLMFISSYWTCEVWLVNQSSLTPWHWIWWHQIRLDVKSGWSIRAPWHYDIGYGDIIYDMWGLAGQSELPDTMTLDMMTFEVWLVNQSSLTLWHWIWWHQIRLDVKSGWSIRAPWHYDIGYGDIIYDMWSLAGQSELPDTMTLDMMPSDMTCEVWLVNQSSVPWGHWIWEHVLAQCYRGRKWRPHVAALWHYYINHQIWHVKWKRLMAECYLQEQGWAPHLISVWYDDTGYDMWGKKSGWHDAAEEGHFDRRFRSLTAECSNGQRLVGVGRVSGIVGTSAYRRALWSLKPWFSNIWYGCVVST